MNLDEVIAEMRRKPDAHLLLKWIDDHGYDVDDIRTAINVYFEALED